MTARLARGRAAWTGYRVVRRFAGFTLLEVRIGTGRTHQIRVHAAHAGYPVAGDEKYGDRDKDAKLKEYGLARMFLHAASLTFRRGEEPFTVTAPLPAELQAVIDELRRRATAR
jgi:23S rRNA pseudouridine955/2504/2580 synthase